MKLDTPKSLSISRLEINTEVESELWAKILLTNHIYKWFVHHDLDCNVLKFQLDWEHFECNEVEEQEIEWASKCTDPDNWNKFKRIGLLTFNEWSMEDIQRSFNEITSQAHSLSFDFSIDEFIASGITGTDNDAFWNYIKECTFEASTLVASSSPNSFMSSLRNIFPNIEKISYTTPGLPHKISSWMFRNCAHSNANILPANKSSDSTSTVALKDAKVYYIDKKQMYGFSWERLEVQMLARNLVSVKNQFENTQIFSNIFWIKNPSNLHIENIKEFNITMSKMELECFKVINGQAQEASSNIEDFHILVWGKQLISINLFSSNSSHINTGLNFTNWDRLRIRLEYHSGSESHQQLLNGIRESKNVPPIDLFINMDSNLTNDQFEQVSSHLFISQCVDWE